MVHCKRTDWGLTRISKKSVQGDRKNGKNTLVMKKFVALTAIGVYFTLSNYCLAYSLVTGEAHNPYQNQPVASEPETASHPGCHGHDEKSGAQKSTEHSHDGQESDTCCVTLTKCLQSTVPRIALLSSPVLDFQIVIVALPDYFTQLHLAKTWLTNHGPPGVSASQGFLSTTSSRAPPYYSFLSL